MIEFTGAALRLSAADIEAEASGMQISSAVVRAVCDVESGGSGFLPDNRPKILFEAHVFGRLTKYKFGDSNISARAWDRSLYGASGAHQYDRLSQAIKLDRVAALQSASWGMFQVLATNYRACSYRDVETFVAGMMASERSQLHAFAAFCDAAGLVRFLRSDPPDFARFARGYNGPAYAANAYDTKLAAAWRKARNGSTAPNPAPRTDPERHFATLQIGSHGATVKTLQAELAELGFDVSLDGDYGPSTMAAVVSFQHGEGLASDGIAGPATWQAIEAATQEMRGLING